MGVELSEAEAWEFATKSHTGILTTLRRDGMPISLPMWFAAFDGAVYLSTPARAKKVLRIKHDPRACFLVESGLAWRELKAVMMTGTISPVNDPEVQRRIAEHMATKYAGFGTNLGKVPDVTRKHYTSGSVTFAFRPTKFITWDNSLIRMNST